MISKILEFMDAAGRLALDNQKKTKVSEVQIKDVSDSTTVVTLTDVAVSNMFKEFVESNFVGLDFLIVDEETIDGLGSNPINRIINTEYAFVIDPIDGTLPFALDMPLFGISIGVLRYGKPYLGVLYAPALRELVYFDGKDVCWLREVFTKNQIKQVVDAEDVCLSNLSIRGIEVGCKEAVKEEKEIFVDFYSAVVNFIYLCTGRLRRYFIKACLWDMAGAWSILNHLGMKMVNVKTGDSLSIVSEQDFDENFVMKASHVVCKR